MTLKIKKGFTLIELIMAVAMVGILVKIAVPYYKEYIYRARFSELTHSVIPPLKVYVGACVSSSECLPKTTVNGKSGTVINTLAATLVFPANVNPLLVQNGYGTETELTSNLQSFTPSGMANCDRVEDVNFMGLNGVNTVNTGSLAGQCDSSYTLPAWPKSIIRNNEAQSISIVMYSYEFKGAITAAQLFQGVIWINVGCNLNDKGVGPECSSYDGSNDLTYGLITEPNPRIGGVTWKIDPASSTCLNWNGMKLC